MEKHPKKKLFARFNTTGVLRISAERMSVSKTGLDSIKHSLCQRNCCD